MTRKRVLFFINSLAGGGAEQVMCTLLAHSRAESEEFDIVLGLLDAEPAAYQVPDWANVRQLDARRSLSRSIVAVHALMAEVQPDVTLSFLTRANMANVINARAPCIISERVNTVAHHTGSRGAVSRALVHAIYPRATRVIAVSEGVAQGLQRKFGVSPERLITIPNPVDVEMIKIKAAEAAESAIDGPYILAVGRLVATKNFAMLIRAFAASGLTQKLVIAGEGEEHAALQQLASDCGVADRVILPGFLANPFPVMRRADLFVLASNAEGFPNALVQAMALGVPVVATNCASGPSEILAEAPRESIGELTFAAHGVVVPPNAPERMAEALRAMADPERRRVYGERAAARARAYNADVVKDRYWNVIRSVLREKT